MRIKAIELSWFRGAADPVELELDCRSMVIYGMNGSGKSSFVDAVEYILKDGRIGHLSHEYSGSRQELGVLNTHTPPDGKTGLKIKFQDDSELATEIKKNGVSTSSGAEAVAMSAWDYQQTVLRQDEVAEFIHDTKGDKYSALLPLFGLYPMELAAENLRQLAKAVESESKLNEMKFTLKQVEAKRVAAFGTHSYDQVIETIADLYGDYCGDGITTDDALFRCEEVESVLDTRIERFSADDRRHVSLQDAAKLDLTGHVDAVRAASVKLAGVVEPLIIEKLEVLRSAHAFVDKLGDEDEVDCPACGQSIRSKAFQEHVKAERERLQEIIEVFDARKAAIGELCDTLRSLKSTLGKSDVKPWVDGLEEGVFADNFSRLDGMDPEALRGSLSDQDLNDIEAKVVPLITAAARDSKDAPPDVQALSTAKLKIEAGKAVIEAKGQTEAVARAEALVAFLNSLEEGVRVEIGLRSQGVIDEISADIQAMWVTLHPGEPIKDVCLYVPPKTEKAVDVELKFHGVKQGSPRLTLSEGYRNSLGLCIFLAMAKRDLREDRPLFLDDVVVSMDRNHRGMIIDLLEKEFNGRQVVILTHDRDWFTELQHQLDANNRWAFKMLLPYETPEIGIRWSHKTTTFDDARSLVNERPDSAGNDARKIMDIELAIVAERLQIRLPYLRSDKNDKRVAHDFLTRLVADGKKCFEKRAGDKYMTYTDAIDACDEARRLLVSWGNRASHTYDLVHPEANKLIDACEKAIEFFRCSACCKNVWFTDAKGSKWVQCHCNQIRWRYGKG